MKTVKVITGLKIEEKPYAKYMEFVSFGFTGLRPIVGEPDSAIADAKKDIAFAPVKALFGGIYGDGVYMCISPEVDYFLGGPFKILEDANATLERLLKAKDADINKKDDQLKAKDDQIAYLSDQVNKITSLGLLARIFKRWK